MDHRGSYEHAEAVFRPLHPGMNTSVLDEGHRLYTKLESHTVAESLEEQIGTDILPILPEVLAFTGGARTMQKTPDEMRRIFGFLQTQG